MFAKCFDVFLQPFIKRQFDASIGLSGKSAKTAYKKFLNSEVLLASDA